MTDIDTLNRLRLDLASELEMLSPAARVTAMDEACERTGGSFIRRRANDHWGSPWCEIAVLGVSANGDGEDDAIKAWIKASLRIAEGLEEAA